MKQDLNLDQVLFLGRQEKSKIPALWSLSDLALIPLRDTPVFRTVIPSKVFESIGMGVPILMSVPTGEATAIVEETETGFCVPPEDFKSMAKKIDELSRSPQELKRARSNCIAHSKRVSRRIRAVEMLEHLQGLTTKESPCQ
jgi:colanic acid biosynthesis glycosyl transferase WcaI